MQSTCLDDGLSIVGTCNMDRWSVCGEAIDVLSHAADDTLVVDVASSGSVSGTCAPDYDRTFEVEVALTLVVYKGVKKLRQHRCLLKPS